MNADDAKKTAEAVGVEAKASFARGKAWAEAHPAFAKAMFWLIVGVAIGFALGHV